MQLVTLCALAACGVAENVANSVDDAAGTKAAWCDAFLLTMDACNISENASDEHNEVVLVGCVDVALRATKTPEGRTALWTAAASCYGLVENDLYCEVALTDCE